MQMKTEKEAKETKKETEKEMKDKRVTAKKVLALLDREYPDHKTLLLYNNPFELLIAVILSAQTTDEQVNRVLPDLFARYPTATELAQAKQKDVEVVVHATGFYKNKTKNIIACAQKLLSDFKGQVPTSMEELTSLPGVGRKTAGVVLYHVHQLPAIIVDTHFGRVCRRLGFTAEMDPTKLEYIVSEIIPKQDWGLASMVVNFHGRRVCKSRAPECERCVVSSLCQNKGNAAAIK